MTNNIWNKKLKGIPGLVSNMVSIMWSKMANWISTCTMLGNIKHHGKHILVMRGCTYRYPQGIEIGDNVIIGKHTSFTADECIGYEGKDSQGKSFLDIKKDVSIGNNCNVDFSGGIIIREEAHIAHNVQITTHDHGFDYRNKPIGKSMEIEKEAFIGSYSIILHNCNYIGKKAIVGSGSVVTKDVPDYAIVAGNPARIIKFVDSRNKEQSF